MTIPIEKQAEKQTPESFENLVLRQQLADLQRENASLRWQNTLFQAKATAWDEQQAQGDQDQHDSYHRVEEVLRQAYNELEMQVWERTSRLLQVNSKLQVEIKDRRRAEEEIRALNAELEQRVRERTSQLQHLIDELRDEIYERKRMNDLMQYHAALLESVSDAVLSTDMELVIRSWNKAAERIYGWREDEVLGRVFTDILTTRHSVMTWQESIDHLHTHGYWQGEVVQLCKDGTPINVLVAVSLLRDRDGQAMGTVAINHDITKWKKAEEDLRQSKMLLQSIIDNSPAAVFVKDLQGKILLYNRQRDGEPQFNTEWAVSKDVRDIITAKQNATLDQHDQHILAANEPIEYEEILFCHDGLHTFMTSKFPLRDAEGSVYAIGCIATDITPHKRAKEELQEAYARLEALNRQLKNEHNLMDSLMDGLQDGLLMLDTQGFVQAINQPIVDLLGINKNILGHYPWVEIYQQVSPSFPCEEALCTLYDRKPRSYRAGYTSPNGQEHILDIRAFPLSQSHPEQQSEDEAFYMIMHVADVTERFNIESRLVQNERLAASGRLAAAVAHEVNTPLQTIRTSLYMIERATDEERTMYLQMSQEEITRISTTLRQLLEVYHSSQQSSTMVQFNDLVKRMVILTSGMMAKQRVEIECDLDPKLPMIRGNTDELTQVLLNLIMNAIEAMPKGGHLWLHTRPSSPVPGQEEPTDENNSPPSIVFEISDTGRGIRPRDIQRIFEPFFTTREEGTGLGLFITHKIIVEHRGTISVRSVLGAGSGFTVTLPLSCLERPEETHARKDTPG